MAYYFHSIVRHQVYYCPSDTWMNPLSLALAVWQVCSPSQWLTLWCWKKFTSSFKISQILKMPQTTEQQPPIPLTPNHYTKTKTKYFKTLFTLSFIYILFSRTILYFNFFFFLIICWCFFWVFPFLSAPGISSPI